MLRLKLFGAPALERDGAPVVGRAAQRHRLALLALLALAPGRRVTRDALIARLWPESDAERGRNLLKVATYVLRSALGDDAIVSAGDELRLSGELVQVDVTEFEQALERGEHARAAALYEGPFMDGFFLGGAHELEQWTERERDRLAARHRGALEALATAAEAARDWPEAVRWWKALAAKDPYDSRVAMRLMQALEASGHRAGALQHASVHQRLLEGELGVVSAPGVAELAERLRATPGTGPVPAASVPDEGAAPTVREGAAEAPVARAATPTPTPRRRWTAASVLGALLLLAGAGWAGWRARVAEADVERSVVVLPFVDLSAHRDEGHEYFSDGLTDEVIARLAAVPGLSVISRTSAMHYKGTSKSLPAIARELGVDHILEGSVREEGGRARITAQLIDARDDRHLWADSYDLALDDRLRAQERIAEEVAGALEVRLRPQVRRRLVRRGTSDPEAYELYQRGRWLWNLRTRDGHVRALDYFQRAIARDSGYADAYAGIADVYLTAFQLNLLGLSEAESYARLRWAAERALALDDESADAHVAIAVALKWRREWPAAEREFRRAIALNPGDATARSWYALLLRSLGRGDEALKEARLSSRLDPFGIVITHNLGWQCYHSRDWACAEEQFRRTLELAPYPGADRWLGILQARDGRFDDAIASVQRAIARAPQRTEFVADLAYVLARAGRTAEARAALARAKEKPIEGFDIARAYIALGEPDSAFAWLGRSNWQWSHRADLYDPSLDPLRGDPRFAALAARVRREMGLQ